LVHPFANTDRGADLNTDRFSKERQMNDFSKVRNFLAACLVLVASASVSGASDPLSESLPASSEYSVVAVVAGVGGVEFSARGWEVVVELSVGLDSDGNVRVNGAVVGTHNPSEAQVIEVNCSSGVASVTVRRASCGTVVCAAPDVAVVISSDTATANGAATSLDVSE
jgi:hypothetical protein